MVILVSNVCVQALSLGYEVSNSGFSHPDLTASETLGLSVFYRAGAVGFSATGYVPLTDPIGEGLVSAQIDLSFIDEPFSWFSLPGRYQPSVSLGVLYDVGASAVMPNISLDLLFVKTQNSSISILSPLIFHVPGSSEPLGWGLSICRFGFLLW